MSLSSNLATAGAMPKSRKSYDFEILASVGLVVVLTIIAVYALVASSGISADDIASLMAYP